MKFALTRLVGMFTFAALLAGCGTTPSSIVQQPTTARPQPVPTQAASNGAIYQAAAYRPLFEDRRARQVGDILTIVISENTQAGKAASSSAAKSSAVDSSVSATGGVPILSSLLGKLSGASLKADASNQYADKSKLDTGNTFTGTVTVTVTEVLANGNLAVAGEKQIALDKGIEYIRLSGVVQPDTILSGNTVASSKVADARIEYRTSAKFDSAEVAGWLARFFLSFIPL
jgi:flagellar L-ring protein precursor FlgH